MTPDESEIYRSAKQMIDKYGPADALYEADIQFRRMAAIGDETGRNTWKRIKAAIIEMNNLDPTDETVH